MVDPVSIGLGAGIVAALNAPAVTKLVETVSSGLGRAFEPRQIRRKALAEAEALVTMAKANVEARDVERRAAERLLATEVRRQENIELIVELASKSMPEEVSEIPVEVDWTSRFFEACKDVSDRDMQFLWGKLLAGEVAQPGSYSLRTLNALQNLRKGEALAFEALCASSMRYGDRVEPLIFSFEPEALEALGIGSYADVLMPLADAGLLRLESLSVKPPPKGPSGYSYDAGEHGRVFVSINPNPDDVEINLSSISIALGEVALSSVGEELSRFTAWSPTEERMRAAIAGWEAAGNIVTIERVADGGAPTIAPASTGTQPRARRADS